jgi:hypothetical protein
MSQPKKPLQEKLTCIGDRLGEIPSSDNVEDGEDEEANEEATELCKPSEGNKHGWVMATISKTSTQRMESIRQKQIWLYKSIQLG